MEKSVQVIREFVQRHNLGFAEPGAEGFKFLYENKTVYLRLEPDAFYINTVVHEFNWELLGRSPESLIELLLKPLQEELKPYAVTIDYEALGNFVLLSADVNTKGLNEDRFQTRLSEFLFAMDRCLLVLKLSHETCQEHVVGKAAGAK